MIIFFFSIAIFLRLSLLCVFGGSKIDPVIKRLITKVYVDR